MKDLLCDEFQATVSKYLIRHRSVLDILSKSQEAVARVNRTVAKAVTSCGCIKVDAERQRVPLDVSLQDLKQFMSSHVQGTLCEQCAEALETEIGNTLFYMAALCNVFDRNLYDILLKEHKKLSTLGVFNFS